MISSALKTSKGQTSQLEVTAFFIFQSLVYQLCLLKVDYLISQFVLLQQSHLFCPPSIFGNEWKEAEKLYNRPCLGGLLFWWFLAVQIKLIHALPACQNGSGSILVGFYHVATAGSGDFWLACMYVCIFIATLFIFTKEQQETYCSSNES